MGIINEVSEILDDDHKYITQLMISGYEEDNKELYTLIPRNLFDSPIPFISNNTYNIVNSSDGVINLFKVTFKEVVIRNDSAEYLFEVLNNTSINNIRKETRQNVIKEAVFSDFLSTSVVRILDLSYSGARIESSEKILSERIELFFDEENTPRRALGKVLWRKFNSHTGKYLYGLKLDYRIPS